MGAPLQLTLNVYQGQTFDDTLTITNEDGTPVDLTGFAPSMDVRAEVTDVDPIVSFGPTDGTLVVSNAAAGVLSFNVPPAQTFALSTTNELQVWNYGVRITASNGYAERVAEGAFVLYPSTDRPPQP